MQPQNKEDKMLKNNLLGKQSKSKNIPAGQRTFAQIFQDYLYLTSDDQQIIQQLRPQSPSGGTALYDCIVQTCTQLIQARQQISNNKQWQGKKIIYVVVCDGEDTLSISKLPAAEKVFKKMLATFEKIQKFDMDIFWIGIQVQGKIKYQLQILSKAASNSRFGLNSYLIYTQEKSLKQQFNNILNKKYQNLRNQKNNEYQRNNPMNQQIQINSIEIPSKRVANKTEFQSPTKLSIQSSKIFYFNIDSSGSMKGKRWEYVCQGIELILGTMVKSDFMKVVTFNECVVNHKQKQENVIRKPIVQIKQTKQIQKAKQMQPKGNAITSNNHKQNYKTNDELVKEYMQQQKKYNQQRIRIRRGANCSSKVCKIISTIILIVIVVICWLILYANGIIVY